MLQSTNSVLLAALLEYIIDAQKYLPIPPEAAQAVDLLVGVQNAIKDEHASRQKVIRRRIEEHAPDGTEDKNKITLHIEDDPSEDYHQYTVSWRDLCGYFAVFFYTETADEARKLFEALKTVKNYGES